MIVPAVSMLLPSQLPDGDSRNNFLILIIQLAREQKVSITLKLLSHLLCDLHFILIDFKFLNVKLFVINIVNNLHYLYLDN